VPLVANNLIIIGLWKILGAKGAEGYKHVSKYQLVMGQPVCKGVCRRTGEKAQKKQPGWAACFLPAVFVGDGELFTGVAATGAKDATAVGAGHSCAEAVFVHTLAAGRLECSFHDISILLFFA
jgi:hypothetical protein